MQRTWESDVCADLALGCAREWILPNRVGGYASESMSGVHTRRQHSLLMAETPEGQRYSLLSCVEDFFDERPLSTHAYAGAFWPEGFRALVRFSLDPAPTWIFSFGERLVAKRVEVLAGRHATRLTYFLLRGAPGLLSIKPLFAFRPQEALRQKQVGIETSFAFFQQALTVFPDKEPLPCVLHTYEAGFHYAPDWFYRFVYQQDKEAGLPHEEDLFTPGFLTIELSTERPYSLWALADVAPAPTLALSKAPSLERQTLELPLFRGPLLIARQMERRRSLAALQKSLAVNAGAFLVETPEKPPKVVSSWLTPRQDLRAEIISIAGLCLPSRAFSLCLSLIQGYAQRLSREPLETEEDAETRLWLIWVARQLEVLSPQSKPALQQALFSLLEPLLVGAPSGLQRSKEGFLAGSGGVSVGLQGLWYHALSWLTKEHPEEPLVQAASLLKESLYNARERLCTPQKTLLTTLDPDDETLSPKSLLVVALPGALFSGSEARPLVDAARAQLLTPKGLRESPHSDIVRPSWLGVYCDAYRSAYGADNAAAREHIEQCLLSLAPLLESNALGFLPEYFEGPAPKGALAFSINLAEPLRILEALGIRES